MYEAVVSNYNTRKHFCIKYNSKVSVRSYCHFLKNQEKDRGNVFKPLF